MVSGESFFLYDSLITHNDSLPHVLLGEGFAFA